MMDLYAFEMFIKFLLHFLPKDMRLHAEDLGLYVRDLKRQNTDFQDALERQERQINDLRAKHQYLEAELKAARVWSARVEQERDNRPLPPLNNSEKDVAQDTPIQAIKAFRERCGCGLKEAKEVVDAWRKADGSIPF